MVSTAILANPDAQVWEMLRLPLREGGRQTRGQAEREAAMQMEAAKARLQPRKIDLNAYLL